MKNLIAVMLVATPAFAGGLLVDGASLPESLRSQVETARAQNPDLFAKVQTLPTVAGQLDRTRRGNFAPMGRMLRALGPDAVWALADLAAFTSPSVRVSEDLNSEPPLAPAIKPSALLSLRLGLVDALGGSGNSAVAPILAATLARADLDPHVLRVAAGALGELGDDASIDALVTAVRRTSGARQLAILEGAGQARRLRTTQLIAQALKTETDPARAQALSRALSESGNATAWMGVQGEAKSEEGAVRELAARGLVDSFVRFGGSGRQEAE
ncbi:MAG: HEAT repeat domain-containing protein, partial [Myxococcaceae bacterium]